MQSISDPLKGERSIAYYIGLASEGYYTKSREEKGEWHGLGAAALRLGGAIDEATLRNLLRGHSPDGKRALVQNASARNRWMAWDLTFSAPKSVSVLWALANRRTRKLIRRAHNDAVQEALCALEERCCITRRGKGGMVREHAKAVFATFFHSESRALDMQIHTHALLINVALRRDGTFGTLHSINFFRAKMECGNIYSQALQRGIQKIHLKTQAAKVGFEIAGVPKTVCDVFSTRRKEILSELERTGKTGSLAARLATLATRPPKQSLSKDKIFALWQDIGHQAGFGKKEAAHLIRSARKEYFNGESAASQGRTDRPVASRQKERNRAPSPSASPKDRKRHHQKGGKAQDGRRTQPQDSSRNGSDINHRQPTQNGRFHWEWRPLFPKAPFFSPTRKLNRPILVYGAAKDWDGKWGRVKWRNSELVNEIRIQDKFLFPKAPEWNPLKNAKSKAIRLGRGKDEKPVLWSASIWRFSLSIAAKKVYPNAPNWSPVKNLSAPVVQVQFDNGKSKSEGLSQLSQS